MTNPPRIAARAIIMHDDRLLLVNAWKGRQHLWCAPGGGVEAHSALPDNVAREVMEETGLTVEVHDPCLINEFHDPQGSFHQIDIYFRCSLIAGQIDADWRDPEGIVSHRRWVTRAAYDTLSIKPDSLAAVAWREPGAPVYDPLEPIVR